MRKIVDELVESRRWIKEDAYNKLMELPYSIMDVKDYKNSIKLDKGSANELEPMTFNNIIVRKNLLNTNSEDESCVIVNGKKYVVDKMVLMVLRGHILSAVSCSENISKAYSDAIVDWLEGNSCKMTEKEAKESLYSCIYYEAYNSLDSIFPMRTVDVDSAIKSMVGA